jgi:Family of unknown function (DUF6292)
VDTDPYGVVVAGLRGYVDRVSRALGVGPDGNCWELEDRASAYIALDGRLPGYPDHDLALIWDEENGWAAALETPTGDDLVVLCYLGIDVLPPPYAVADFVAALRADDYPGQPDPPALRAAFADDGFDDRLAG